MTSTMFSSVQERHQSRRGRKRWKRDFWGPQGGGDHRGKRYFKGSVRGCLVRKRLNPQLLKSPLSIVCECARGISALSLKLPCQDSFRGSFWSCCDSSRTIPCMRGYIRYNSQWCPWYFLLVGKIIYGNKHDTLLEIKAGGAVDSYQIDTHTNLWYGQEAY